MITINDGLKYINSYFNNGFSIDEWKRYIETVIPNASNIFLTDMNESISPKYSYEEYFLPCLNNACIEKEKISEIRKVFMKVVDGINEKVSKTFSKDLKVEIVLYFGLCNGAGWVTTINNWDYVLLGVEKIIELNWGNENDLIGLIYHELGHVLQSQFGRLKEYTTCNKEYFLWQLFTEGVAMYVEQAIVDDFSYFHQDKNGWKKWNDNHLKQIVVDFNRDCVIMEREKQRYFGDWVDYFGHSDVGYYLGNMFVKWLMKNDSFDNIINYHIGDVTRLWDEYYKSIKKNKMVSV